MRILILIQSIFLFSFSILLAQSDQLFETAEQQYQDEAYEASLKTLEQFVDKFPDRKYDLASAYFLMSANFMKLKEMEGAVWANQQSLELRNKLRTDQIVENTLRFGEIYLQSRRYDDALSYLLQAIEMPFENPEIFAQVNFHLAEVYQALGDFEKADIYYYRTSQILSVEFGEDHEQLVTIYLQQARLALGFQDFEKGLMYFGQAEHLMSQAKVSRVFYEEPFMQLISDLGLGKYNGETSSRVMLKLVQLLFGGLR